MSAPTGRRGTPGKMRCEGVNLMRVCGVLLWALSFVAVFGANGQAQKLNNDAVLKMKAAGLGDDTIVRAIQATPGEYDTSASGLISLKTGGVSDAVLVAILNHGKGSDPPVATSAVMNDGFPNELGVYYLKEHTYVALEPEIMNIRTTNPLATGFTYGIKAEKLNGWIVGQHSKNRFGSEIRAFFLDIPEGVSPAEYTLLRFHEKGDRREVELGRARWAVKMGTQVHSAVSFESQKVGKGKYKLTVSALNPGEYGFMPPGAELSKNSVSVGKIYSFQVIE